MRCFKAMSSSHARLEFAPGVWRGLMQDLRRRGRGQRESGAFLLARRDDALRVVRTWLAYDELAPESLNHGYVRLETSAFSRLWEWCDQRQLHVAADVHTHPWGPGQSDSDRAFPMIALAGHIALIVPSFALGEPQPIDVSFNVYQGGGRWISVFGRVAASKILAP